MALAACVTSKKRSTCCKLIANERKEMIFNANM